MTISEVEKLFYKKGWEIYAIREQQGFFRVFFSDSFLWYCVFYPEDKEFIPDFYSFYNSDFNNEKQVFKGGEFKPFGKRSGVYFITNHFCSVF